MRQRKNSKFVVMNQIKIVKLYYTFADKGNNIPIFHETSTKFYSSGAEALFLRTIKTTGLSGQLQRENWNPSNKTIEATKLILRLPIHLKSTFKLREILVEVRNQEQTYGEICHRYDVWNFGWAAFTHRAAIGTWTVYKWNLGAVSEAARNVPQRENELVIPTVS